MLTWKKFFNKPKKLEYPKKVATITMPMKVLIVQILINAKIAKMVKIFIRNQNVLLRDSKSINLTILKNCLPRN